MAAHEDHAEADNPAYAPIVFEAVEEDAVQVVAELVEVLGPTRPLIES